MPERIMVMDAAPEMLDLFQELLQDEGYEVFPYTHAIDDLREVERLHPDLLILDYIMDGAAVGRQLLQRLKMRAATATIPVIVCSTTSNAAQTALEEDHLTSHVRLIAKPFDVDELLIAVKHTLRERARTLR